MNKKDKKQMEKIIKEKDKLEMQAMVLRMQERDANKKSDQIVESQQHEIDKLPKD